MKLCESVKVQKVKCLKYKNGECQKNLKISKSGNVEELNVEK